MAAAAHPPHDVSEAGSVQLLPRCLSNLFLIFSNSPSPLLHYFLRWGLSIDKDGEASEPSAFVIPEMAKIGPNTKVSCKDRNDQKWNYHKDEIRQIYIGNDKTLQETMSAIEQRYGFQARYVLEFVLCPTLIS
jgi:hypothetical protein